MNLARGASCAAICVRVGQSTLPSLPPTYFRSYSSRSTPPGLVDSLKTRWTLWLDRTRPIAIERFSELSRQWKSVSGYEAIEKLKDQVEESKNAAKSAYVQAVADRSAAQRKISDLLTRKSTWNDAELAEYTTLLHKEHSFAKAEENNEREYQQAEDHMERGFDDLMRSVMRRYHEEHLWSDRVRSVSSYISLGLGVANEPYKRWKLARALEERVIHNEQEAYNRMQATISSIETHLEQLEEDITGKKRTKSVPNALRDSAPPAAPPGGSNTMMPPTPPRRIFPALPRLTWVDNVVHWFHVFRDYTVGFLRSWLPSAPSEQTTLAASTTGALVAGIATFWASTLFL